MTDHTAYIGLGSNLGETEANLNAALETLEKHPSISEIQVSSYYETKPLGRLIQPAFLNAAAKVVTTLSAWEVFQLLRQTELDLGRETFEHWGPRKIDLDLLLYDDAEIDEPDLTVPHSQMHLRSFVLRGLCELSPDIVHPKLGRSVSTLYKRLNGQDFALDPTKPQLVSIAGNIGVGKTTLAAGLAERLGAIMIAEKYEENPYLSDVYDGHEELALDSELYFLASGASQLTKDKLDAGVCYVSDYVFDKAMIYASAWLEGVDFRKYIKHYKAVRANVTEPVAVIYLQDSPENCMERIHRRNRPYEQHIELSFLQHLADGYEKLYTDDTVCPLIQIHADQCRDDQQVDRIANELRYYLDIAG